MTDEERELLSTVATLNRRMGSVVVALLSTTGPNGELSITRFEAVADIVSDMSALLENYIDRVRQREGLVVIDGDVQPSSAEIDTSNCQGVASDSPGVRAALVPRLGRG